ncbi:hypothetical protein [Vibrio phage Va2]|nr:hypothetical protein [Vibrio phage Va2]
MSNAKNTKLVDKRIYLLGQCGAGKSTFAEELCKKFARVRNFGNVAEKALSGNRVKDMIRKNYPETYAKQSVLYHFTKEKMQDRTYQGGITIFERSLIDWLDGSLGHFDPYVRKEFHHHFQTLKNQSERRDLWERTRFIITPAPSLALIEKNPEIFLDGGKREEFYTNQLGWDEKTSTKLKLRMLHERFLDVEFSQLNLLRTVAPYGDLAKELDHKVIHVRELPSYRGKNFNASTYYEWKEHVELVLSEFLMEY